MSGVVRRSESVRGLIRRVEAMPSMPSPYRMIDWKARTRDYVGLVFDADARGDFLPLYWTDRSGRNTGRATFGLPSYVGSPKRRTDGSQEAINCASAVLSASLCGCLPTLPEGLDPVAALESFFNRDNGLGLFLNSMDGRTGGSFWYEIEPLVLLAGIVDRHPGYPGLVQAFLDSARRWLEALDVLGGATADFHHTAFDFKTMRPVDNGRWKEPDAAAGLAFVFQCAHSMTGMPEWLAATRACLDALERTVDNPYYELLLPYGALAAARCNRLHGTRYDVARLLAWCFDGDSAARPGWGVIAERWGDFDCHGLVGSLTDYGQRWDLLEANASQEIDPHRSGYAFAGNTFSMAAPLLALVGYDPRFARDIGKWMLNAASAARLYYPDAHPPVRQSCAFWKDDPKSSIAYEGLRKSWDGHSPYATGDPQRYSWGTIDIGLYGSSFVGNFGGTLETTAVEGVLQLDCSATDYHGDRTKRTLLFYNPHGEVRTLRVSGVRDEVRIPPDEAVLVEVGP